MKIQGSFYELKSKKIQWKILELWISMKFGQQAPCYTLLPGKKNQFPSKGDQKFEFHSKREIGSIS
jgi:hypothetical protein